MKKQTDEKGKPMTYWGGNPSHKQQTAVDYLFNELLYKSTITGKYIFRDYKLVEYYLSRAKEIEKHDIIQAYLDGNCSYDDDNIDNVANEYYKNKFEK